jgi:hypothetical protein
VACVKPRAFLGARNLRIVFEIVERDALGKLVPVDLTAASSPPGFVDAFFRKPSGEVELVHCAVDAPQTDGLASYFTAAGFLDEAGDWEAQALVGIPGSGPGQGFFPSAFVLFEVVALLRPFSPAGTLALPATPLRVTAPTVVRHL